MTVSISYRSFDLVWINGNTNKINEWMRFETRVPQWGNGIKWTALNHLYFLVTKLKTFIPQYFTAVFWCRLRNLHTSSLFENWEISLYFVLQKTKKFVINPRCPVGLLQDFIWETIQSLGTTTVTKYMYSLQRPYLSLRKLGRCGHLSRMTLCSLVEIHCWATILHSTTSQKIVALIVLKRVYG
jgi:hypothetical protein